MERIKKMSEPQIIKSSVFADTRGFFSEVLKEYDARQINMSWSIGGTFRGIHAQRLMDKAMWIGSGEATIFAVNLDPSSALFGQVIKEDMKAGDGKVFYAPWWWGRGFLAKTDCTVVYATTDVYRPEHEIAVSYLGLPDIKDVIEKSRLNLIISEKDQKSLDINGGIETIANWKRAGDQIAAELE
jgi:dTDP-4-dehydrorhamnose 3,5-epimerase-like enzyme